MKVKGINTGKIITSAFPEIMAFLSQMLTYSSLYVIIFIKDYNWLLLSVMVSSALGTMNLAVLLFSIRPWKLSLKILRKNPDMEWAFHGTLTITILIIFTAIVLLPGTLLIKSAYAQSLLMLACGSGWAIVFSIGIISFRKAEGLKRPVFKFIKVWYLAILLLAAIAFSSWKLADWNPVLRHIQVNAKVTAVHNIRNVSQGDTCIADIGWFPSKKGKKKCRARFFCNSKRLYGKLGKGVFPCTVTDETVINGRDDDINDGDPAFSINTEKSKITFTSKRNKQTSSLTAEILKRKTIP